MKFRRVLTTAAALGLLCFASASDAFAITISGSSEGSFSNLTGCDKNGSDRECGIVRTDANGSKTQVRWPYLDDHDQIDYASRLTAVDVDFSATNAADDVVIARLDWFNAATNSDITPDSLGVTWTLKINFNNPDHVVDTERFGLAIFNSGNPAGDTISGLADLSDLSFSLDGVTIGDFQYVVLDGWGNCNGTDTGLSGTSWYNCENNNASLLITADFIIPGTDGGDSSAVPEPATLALLVAGLIGLAAIRRRRKAA